jgi:predicted NBD/HSP70 family sugar kinase/biotin operon repressor
MNGAWEPAAFREANTRSVLNLLRSRNAPVSRQYLAEESGLSLVTVGKIIKQLERVGFVKETDSDRQGGGRPVGLIEIHSHGGYVVGVLPRSGSLDGVIMDLRGNVIDTSHRDVDMLGHADTFNDTIAEFVQALIEHSTIDRLRILGVGLGMPGLIDAATGKCLDAWALGIRDLEIAEPLGQLLQLPLLIDNDANCLGAYEVLFGDGTARGRSLIVSVGKGLGMAIVIDDLVYRGASGMAGDFGHSPVLGGDRPCECGRPGCLETYCSDRGIIRNFEVATGRIEPLDVIIASAAAGDTESDAAIAQAGTALGVALSAAIHTLDPAAIALVLADGIAAAGSLLTEPMRRVLNVQLENRPLKPPIVIERVGYERWAQGAASLALNQFFTPGALSFAPITRMAAV